MAVACRAAPAGVGLALANMPRSFDAIAKRKAELSFIAFVELFWPVIEPRQPFVKGWVQELIAQHLELVHEGKITKILFNVPPGFSKSTLCNVFFAAWEWGPKKRPDLRYISWSYSAGLTKRDNGLCRKIIESPLYQRLWGQCEPCKAREEGTPRCKTCELEKRFRFDGDQNAVTRYRNDWGGWRFSSSVGGAGTGERADRLIFDDPHNVKSAESEAKRIEAIDWFAGTLPSRVRNAGVPDASIRLPDWVRRAHKMEDDTDDPGALQSATIGIMQRVHLQDVSGVILETPELGYTHVLVELEYQGDAHPARIYDPEIDRAPSPGSPHFVDPRRAKLAAVPPQLEPLDESDEAKWWAAFGNVWTRIAVDIVTLADPVRFPRKEVEELKAQMRKKSGPSAEAAQLQQWPQERGGDYFPKANLKPLSLEELEPSACGYFTRGWDLAATDSDRAAATVGVLLYVDILGRVVVLDVVKIRGDAAEVDKLMKATADADRDRWGNVHQDFPTDPGAAGKYQTHAFVRNLIGHILEHSPERESKETRAWPLSSQWKGGNCYVLATMAGLSEYKRIMAEFPVGRFKDEVDASTRAFDSQIRATPAQTNVGPISVRLAK